MTGAYRSPWMTEELDTFRDQFRRFLVKELAPRAEGWRRDKIVDRAAWRALGISARYCQACRKPMVGRAEHSPTTPR